VCAVCTALLVFVPGVHEAIVAADSITPVTVQAIDAWVQAVHKHVPGTPDESVAAVRRLTYQIRVEMNSGNDTISASVAGCRSARSGTARQSS
jgi:hypothetical protein